MTIAFEEPQTLGAICKLTDWCGFTMCPHAPIAIRVHVKLRLFSAGRGFLVRRGKASPPFTDYLISLMGPQGRVGVPVSNHITKNNFNTTSIVDNMRFTVLYLKHNARQFVCIESLVLIEPFSSDWPLIYRSFGKRREELIEKS